MFPGPILVKLQFIAAFMLLAVLTGRLASWIIPRPGTVIGGGNLPYPRSGKQHYLYVVARTGYIAKIAVDSGDFTLFTRDRRMYYPGYATARTIPHWEV